jgi:hypothetical protein
VTHEGLRDHDSFNGWAEELDARLALGPAGDSDPALVYWIDELLARWPRARFVVISREDEESLEALATAAPYAANGIRTGWSGFLSAFKGACDRLREAKSSTPNAQRPTPNAQGALANAPATWKLGVERWALDVEKTSGALCRFWNYEDLGSDETVLDIMQFATGHRPSALWARRMQRLRVTSTIVPVECSVKPLLTPPIEVPRLEGLDTTGLSAALYRNADFMTIAEWWQIHTGQLLAQAALPPLGVVVSDAEGPAAALWCYECYGVPVAELAFPVTRPGLPLRRAASALCYAVAACIATAGKAHQPEASFRLFKTFAPRGLARYLKRLGFRDALSERVAMTYSS